MKKTSTRSESYLNQVAKYGQNKKKWKKQEEINEKTLASVGTLTSDSNTDIVLVDFILNLNKRFRSVFRKQMTVKSMKERLADVLDTNEEEFMLIWRNQVPDNSMCLDKLVENPLVPIEIELNFINLQHGMEKFKENIPSVEVITVHPQYGEFENVTVIIEDQALEKKWLGGYRNKLNGKEYHHALAQTMPREGTGVVQFHRDTQTASQKTTDTLTLVSRGTQMARADLYIPSDHDKIVVPRTYKQRRESKLQLESVIVIQRAWRLFCRRKWFFDILSKSKQQHENKKKIMEEVALEHARKERLIIVGAVYPSKRDNFYWFYLSLGLWLKAKGKSFKVNMTEPSRKAFTYYLLMKEIKGLYAIEKLKIEQKKEALKKEDIRFLDKACRPKIFRNKSGNLVSLADLDNQRARELKEIYSELIKEQVKAKDRIGFLSSFRKMFAVDYASYEYASEIVSLVDREITLMTMGMRNKDLKGLRMRIEQLYMNFVKQPEFNPNAAKYQKGNLPHSIRQKFRCIRCGELVPPSKFPVHLKMTSFSVCTSCDWMYSIGSIHIDLAPYKKLLYQVRQDEMEECSESAVSFLLQPPGMAYLTTKIWHGHSTISQCSDLAALCHVRWRRDEEWSPWNTILLTTAEAQYHRCIPDVYQFYTPRLIMLVHQRHIIARHHFKGVEKVDSSLCTDKKLMSTIESALNQKYYTDNFITEDDTEMI